MEEALDAMSSILDLEERRDQILQSTVKIMLCLNSEARTFMGDCQALLVQGGLEALRQRRRDLIDSLEAPIAVLDPEEDQAFDSIASAMDALRLSEVAFQVMPDLGRSQSRWRIARALLGKEAQFEEELTRAIRSRGNPAEFDKARQAIQIMIQGCDPPWSSRAGAIRSACRDVLREGERVSPERLEGETDTLFALFVTADERALPLLEAIDRDPGGAIDLISRTYAHLNAARTLLSEIEKK
jgi:hypothetical protein